MSERQPWWKSFLGIRKTPGQKDMTLDPDFDPFKPEKAAKDAKMAPGPKASSQTQPGNKESSRDSDDETYDDSHMDSVFNEQTCRRNMRVSRSGRFKEKRRVRSTLPTEEQQQQQDKNGARNARGYTMDLFKR
ncbi:unnamed protein product [Boreogadus saida]